MPELLSQHARDVLVAAEAKRKAEEERKKRARGLILSPHSVDVLAGLPDTSNPVMRPVGIVPAMPGPSVSPGANQTATLNRQTTTNQPSAPAGIVPTAPTAPAGPGRPSGAKPATPGIVSTTTPPSAPTAAGGGLVATKDPNTGEQVYTYGGVALSPELRQYLEGLSGGGGLGGGIRRMVGGAGPGASGAQFEKELNDPNSRLNREHPEAVRQLREGVFKQRVEQEAATKGLTPEAATTSLLLSQAETTAAGRSFAGITDDITRLKALSQADILTTYQSNPGAGVDNLFSTLTQWSAATGQQLDFSTVTDPALQRQLLQRSEGRGPAAAAAKVPELPQQDLSHITKAIETMKAFSDSGAIRDFSTLASTQTALDAIRAFQISTADLGTSPDFTITTGPDGSIIVTPSAVKGSPGYDAAVQRAEEMRLLVLHRNVLNTIIEPLQKEALARQAGLLEAADAQHRIDEARDVDSALKETMRHDRLIEGLDVGRAALDRLSLYFQIANSDIGLEGIITDPTFRALFEAAGITLPAGLDAPPADQATTDATIQESFGGVLEAARLAQSNPTEFRRRARPLLLKLHLSLKGLVDYLNAASQNASPGRARTSAHTFTTGRE